MGGRADYEERKKQKIERYTKLSKRAKERSISYSNSKANKILEIAPGQPIIVGHHSEKMHRRLIEKAHNDIRKSIELDDKSKFYNDRARAVKDNKAIYNDDPNAIKRLKEKLERLENQKASIKSREHLQYELNNINANIRETKLRIKRLEKQENIKFDDMQFQGGKAIHNKEINRIQLLFDCKPNEKIRNELKHNGFHWSNREKAWQREFNEKTIRVTISLIKSVLNNENEMEEEEYE